MKASNFIPLLLFKNNLEESTQATVEEGGNKKKSHSKEEYDDGAPESVPCKVIQ